MLKITDLKVNYGGIEAVKGITFSVPEKSIVTLIGANGAGKSTTLRTISGLIKPGTGKIEFLGEDITGKDAAAIVSKGITMVPEGRRIFPDLTVLENLKIGAYLRSDDLTEDLKWVYELFPRLKERSWQLGGTLSGGEQQMLAVGRAIMTGCDFILLDEPSMGLAPLLMYEMFRTLKKLNELGLTILLIEQNAKVALNFAHRGYVLDTGEIKTSGTAEELKHDPEVKKAYLGG